MLGGGSGGTEAELGPMCLLRALLPDAHSSPGHLSLPGVSTSKGPFLLDLFTSTQGCGSFGLHRQGLAWCVVDSRCHEVPIESRKWQSGL